MGTGESVLQIRNVKKSYRNKRSKEWVEAVKGISLDVCRGEVVGLLGPNGAGKTTFIKMMSGLLVPDEGEVQIHGISMNKQRLKALQHISVVLEGNRNLYWRMTAKENLEYFSGNRGLSRKELQSRIAELLDMFRLSHKADEQVNRLSRGMQQKVSIAVSLLADTDVIFLDEPTLGLDVDASYDIREVLHRVAIEEQKTVLLSSHDMPVVQQICERAVIINEGRVVADDRVSSLLELFSSKAYAFVLNQPLTTKGHALFEEADVLYSVEETDPTWTLHVTMQQDADFYRVVDLLKDADASIQEVNRDVVDFEKVFVNIVKGGGHREVVASV